MSEHRESRKELSMSADVHQSAAAESTRERTTLRTFNIRLGHACNSSSTHSIVPLSALGGASDDYEHGEFGWSHFMLASEQAKMEYLAATLAEYEPTPERAALIREITGLEPDPGDEWHGGFGYVDHQSRMALPVEGPHAKEFLSDLADYLRRDDVVILGGNDNGGRMTAAHLPIPVEASAPRMRPGTAPDGSRYWTVMDGRRGDRIRFSFRGQPLSGPGEADYGIPAVEAEPLDLPCSTLPELVDMKVTAFCPFEKDCPWCYMGSTKEGKHTGWKTASAYLDALAEAEVFEIALGGGEPTLWPHLGKFVRRARKAGINVNLTTKNIAWLKPGNLDGLGAIAVSLNNRRDLDRFQAVDLSAIRDGQQWYERTEITVQCVPAFCDDELLADIIATAKDHELRVTFLGVKRTGRATDEQRKDDLRWLELLKPYREDWWLHRGVAVDTLMASAAEQAFRDLGVDPVWYETTEGRFSCYIDVTTGRLAASSYVIDDAMLAFKPGDDLGETFRAMQTAVGLRA